jgi:carboxypeptidase C (cathepsin A)
MRVVRFKRWVMPAMALTVTLALAACGGGGSGSSTPTPGFFDPALYSSDPGASLAQPADLAATTHHQIVVNGVTLAYTAAAGHLTAKNPTSGAAEASFFYVAYTLDNKPPATRPVTFFYNGGPGTPSGTRCRAMPS